MVYNFFDKKFCYSCKLAGSGIKNDNIWNQELGEELYKLIIRKFEKKVHLPFIDNICGDYLTDVRLLSKFNKVIRVLLCVLDIFSKYVWVVTLKDKKGFEKILDESNPKPIKIWVDKAVNFTISKWNHG